MISCTSSWVLWNLFPTIFTQKIFIDHCKSHIWIIWLLKLPYKIHPLFSISIYEKKTFFFSLAYFDICYYRDCFYHDYTSWVSSCLIFWKNLNHTSLLLDRYICRGIYSWIYEKLSNKIPCYLLANTHTCFRASLYWAWDFGDSYTTYWA